MAYIEEELFLEQEELGPVRNTVDSDDEDSDDEKDFLVRCTRYYSDGPLMNPGVCECRGVMCCTDCV